MDFIDSGYGPKTGFGCCTIIFYDNVMSGSYCTDGGDEKMHIKFHLENMKGEDHLKKQGVGHVNWFHLAHDRNQWQVLVIMIMN
jgi:hypothetical protein